VTKRVLVTGATGFVGRTLCEALTLRGVRVRRATRAPCAASGRDTEVCVVGEIGSRTQCDRALEGVDWLMHLAARVHVLKGKERNSAAFHEVNALGTGRLAAAAARSGVAQFVYLSSVKVNGEATLGAPYSASDQPRPADSYARSTWEGEIAVRDASLGS